MSPHMVRPHRVRPSMGGHRGCGDQGKARDSVRGRTKAERWSEETKERREIEKRAWWAQEVEEAPLGAEAMQLVLL